MHRLPRRGILGNSEVGDRGFSEAIPARLTESGAAGCAAWHHIRTAKSHLKGRETRRRRSAMLARVVTIRVKPEKMDECIAIFKEVNAPSIAVRPGFDHGHWWVDRTSGEATSVTF